LVTSVALAWLCQAPVTLNLFQGLMLLRDAETNSAWRSVISSLTQHKYIPPKIDYFPNFPLLLNKFILLLSILIVRS